MPQPTQSSSSGSATARALAVLAILIAFVASIAVITGSLGGGSDSGDGGSRNHPRASRPKHPTEKYYVIQAGDTFDAIAAKAGISPTKLAQLNPDLDTQQLPITGCVNLVPEGCKILTQGG
jgi:hypothetical protein